MSLLQLQLLQNRNDIELLGQRRTRDVLLKIKTLN